MEAPVPRPSTGRVFETEVPVRFGDCEPGGRLRLDALARILQDAGNDDFADAGLEPASPWVARRSVVVAGRWPRIGDRLGLATWCGGMGSRWAERRSSVTVSPGGAAVEVATLWVHLDGAGRPARLPGWFVDTYGEAAGGRRVSTRLHLGPPPPGRPGRAWALRATDLDVLGHVNNAAVWAPVEDELVRRRLTPSAVELEFAGPLLGDDVVRLQVEEPPPPAAGRPVLRLWLTVGGEVRVAAALEAVGGQGTR